mgnify:CR=1 FL=1
MQIILLIPTWLVLRPNWLVPRPTIRLRVSLLLLRAGRLAHTPTSIRTARLQLVVHAWPRLGHHPSLRHRLVVLRHQLGRRHLLLRLHHMRG